MRGYRFPSTETEHQTVISRFGGADFRSHPTKVSLTRSPDLQNLVCDRNDFLVKRTGWQVQQRYDAPVYGIFSAPDGSGAFIHTGADLYFRAENGQQTVLCRDMNGAFSQAFTMNGVLYLLDGAPFRAVRRGEGGAWEAVRVQSIAYVPTTTVSAPPAGGGASLEAVNLLTGKTHQYLCRRRKKRRNFIWMRESLTACRSPLRSTALKWPSRPSITMPVRSRWPPPRLTDRDPTTSALPSSARPFRARRTPSTNAASPVFTAARTTRAFSLQAIPTSRTATGRVDFTIPPISPIPGLARMGTEASAIAGYLKQYESQIIVKTGGAQEATSFARTFVMTEDGTSYFTLRQGAHGEGAVAPRTFAMLNDVPLFLSAQGVMGVYGTAVAEQNTIRSISESVRPRLVQEKAMENACAVVFEGRYYLALGGNVYIADGHLNEEDGYPAWFFWTNVPAQCLAVLGGRLWFGTNDGRLCRFSLPEDADAYTDDGEAIDAYWCTPTLSLSDWTRYKTIRDIIPTLMPYTRSSAALCFTDEGGETFPHFAKSQTFSPFAAGISRGCPSAACRARSAGAADDAVITGRCSPCASATTARASRSDCSRSRCDGRKTGASEAAPHNKKSCGALRIASRKGVNYGQKLPR